MRHPAAERGEQIADDGPPSAARSAFMRRKLAFDPGAAAMAGVRNR
ncbi:hypothetical protein C8F00_2849 [Xanthomonas vasicola]